MKKTKIRQKSEEAKKLLEEVYKRIFKQDLNVTIEEQDNTTHILQTDKENIEITVLRQGNKITYFPCSVSYTPGYFNPYDGGNPPETDVIDLLKDGTKSVSYAVTILMKALCSMIVDDTMVSIQEEKFFNESLEQ